MNETQKLVFDTLSRSEDVRVRLTPTAELSQLEEEKNLDALEDALIRYANSVGRRVLIKTVSKAARPMVNALTIRADLAHLQYIIYALAASHGCAGQLDDIIKMNLVFPTKT